MPLKTHGHSLISRWGNWSLNHPLLVLLTTVLLSYLAWQYTAENLSINTDTAEMVAPDAPFQQNRRKFEKQFSQELQTLLLVVKSDTPELTKAATERLGRMLKADQDNFSSVYIPNDNAFFQKNGLLYLDASDLQDLSDTLSQAQPFIGRLYQETNLSGFFSIFEDALLNSDTQELPVDLPSLLNKVSLALHKTLNGDNALLSWEALITDQKPFASGNGFILALPKFDYTQIRPAENAINAIRKMERQIQDPNLPPVNVLITGEAGLEDDELAGMSTGTFTASLFSLLVVLGILLMAYRSVLLTLSTLITLALGMVFCGAFAAVAVRELNLISVAFAVSNIGLGVEYSIHFCLRYHDYINNNCNKERALQGALVSTTPSLLLCAFTTAIGLYAFIPTDYKGVSELGLLAGTSLFICLCITLMVLPVLLRILPPPAAFKALAGKPGLFNLVPRKLAAFTLHYAKPITIATVILAIVSAALMPRVQTDFNPINLRDPNSESVIAFKELTKDKDTTPMTLTVLTQDSDRAKALQQKMERLSSVERTLTLFDFVPKDQEDKLFIVDEMATVLGFQARRFPALKLETDPTASINRMLVAINQVLPSKTDDKEIAALKTFKTELEGVLLEIDNRQQPDRAQFIARIQTTLLGTLPNAMNELLTSLNAEAITPADLPTDIKERWLSKEGWYRIQIFPKKDLNDLTNLEEFITQVQSVAPDTTDLPIMYWESMKEVINAFQQAIYIALITIAVVLMAIRRSITDTLLIMTPLMLAGLFTMASTVLTQTPVNFANIIALPLLLGFGVDNGIHMVEKLRHSLSEKQNIYQSSTARAMFYGALTTSSSFGGLAFSPHQGIASMGLVITMGIFWIVTCTFVILPALGKLVLKNQAATVVAG